LAFINKCSWGRNGLKYEVKLEYIGGREGGGKTKNLALREYGYFLELHIV